MRFILIAILTLLSLEVNALALTPEHFFRARERLTNAASNPTWESVDKIATSLRGIARNMNPADSDDYGLYKELQSGMMEIPNHVGFLSGKLEQERQRTAHLPYGVGERTSYQSMRKRYILETFPHLPGPETIKALGEYLYDDSDTPPPPRPGRTPGGISANSVLASNVLTRIGLIDPPRHNLKAQKKWWEQVKAGKRWFAFHGQPVSYRFRPDGTVETKPRDASKDPRWIAHAYVYDLIPEPDIPVSRYWWTGGGIATVLMTGGAVYMIRRRRLRKAAA